MTRPTSSKWRAVIAVAVFCVATAGVAGQGRATTMLYLSMQDLYERSDAVVRGVIEGHTTFWTEEGQLMTDWTLRVDEVLYGDAPPVVTFRQMGGELDGRRLHVEGDAQLADGEPVVLFLVLDDGVYYLTALGQSKLSVTLQGELGVPGGSLELPSPRVGPVQATLVRELGGLVFYRHTDDGGAYYPVDDEVLTLQDLRELSPSYESTAMPGGEQ